MSCLLLLSGTCFSVVVRRMVTVRTLSAPFGTVQAARTSPSTVRTDNTSKIRFCATLGEESEVELALAQRLGASAPLTNWTACRPAHYLKVRLGYSERFLQTSCS